MTNWEVQKVFHGRFQLQTEIAVITRLGPLRTNGLLEVGKCEVEDGRTGMVRMAT